MATSSSVGVPRDESFYFMRATWLLVGFERLADSDVDSFSKTEIERGFKYNREHPVLMKSLFGLSHRFLHQKWGWVSDPIYRLSATHDCDVRPFLWLVWLLGLMWRNRVVGSIAVASMPSCRAFSFMRISPVLMRPSRLCGCWASMHSYGR